MIADLLKPPTDNLYKFLAIFGTVVFVIGFVFPPLLFYQSSLELLKSAAGDKELAVHQEFTGERIIVLDERKRQLKAEMADLQRRLAELKAKTTSSSEADKLESAIKEARKDFETLEDASYELRLSLRVKAAQVDQQRTLSTNETRNARLLIWIGWGLGIFGLMIAICGFVLWYVNVQKFQDNILRREANSTTTNSGTEAKTEAKPAELSAGAE